MSLAPLAGDTDPSAAIRRACEGPGSHAVVLAERTLGVHTVFSLPESHEAYLSSLTPKFRSNLRRHLKGLGKNFNLETRVVDDPEELQEQFPVVRCDAHEAMERGRNARAFRRLASLARIQR